MPSYLAGGGALTKHGQEGIERILTSLKIHKRWWDEVICLVSALLLSILILFWFSLPQIAIFYKNIADKAFENGQFLSAENNYKKALNLDSNYTGVHYQLGKLYQELQEYDKAIENYKLAVKGNYPQAAGDIANLYLQMQEYSKADKWLSIALEPQRFLLENQRPYALNEKQILMLKTIKNAEKVLREKINTITEEQFQALKKSATINDQEFSILEKLAYIYIKKGQYADAYSWLKLGAGVNNNNRERKSIISTYLGWILLKQKDYDSAESQLRQAISLDNPQKPKAIAHCLLAQTQEGLKNEQNARLEWEQCLKYANQKDQDEYTWIGIALQRLNAKGENK